MAASLHLPLLRAEVSAARIEGVLRAEPEVGRLWRMEASFAEAVRSVALEDVKLSESDLVARLTLNRQTEIDARGAEMAEQVLRVLRSPGDLMAEPLAALRRIERAGAPLGAARDPEEMLEDDEALALLADLGDWTEMPIAGALRLTAAYAIRTGRQSPVAERLLFAAAEGALRARGGLERPARREAEAVDATDLMAVPTGQWVVAPATALLRRGFRIWSPLKPGAMRDYLAMVAESLAWDLGRLGPLRHQVARIRAASSGRRGHSRMTDMADFVLARPVFTSALVMEELGLTRRGALNLINDLETAGLVRNILPRRAARIWATASLAERLQVRALHRPSMNARGARGAAVEPAAPAPTLASPAPRGLRESGRAGMEQAMADLDRALAEAGQILDALPRR